jgi:pimeloyl-ACP methyl ester carboxylesterase
MSGSPAPLERWASLRVPTLVMAGGASPSWQQHGARALASVLPDARHRTLDGQDHGPAHEVLLPVLEGFFTDRRRGPAADPALGSGSVKTP